MKLTYNYSMKKLILAVMVLSTIFSSCDSQKKSQNVLLAEFNTPYATPPFDKIDIEDYLPAFEAGIAQSRSDVDSIVANQSAPTFENTIEALERQGELLNRVAKIFFTLNEAQTSERMDEIALEVQPKLTELGNDISLNPKLFERVKAVYAAKDSLNLDSEQKMLLEDTYKSFARNGAELNDADKEKYRAISGELSALELKFGQNVLTATNAYSLTIPATDSAKIAELPGFVKEAMAQDAEMVGVDGWVVTLQAPSMIPFMMYSSQRDLKKQLWMASSSKAFGGANDNSEIIKKITKLRLAMANLLGYATYADYVLEERMAENAPNVNKFLGELLTATKPAAQAEFDAIKSYAAAQGCTDFMPWDWAYYIEKYKNEKYALNQELIKPYLKLENVQKGVFMLAEKLYGLTFKENKELPIYHPDVQAYEVYDKDGKFLSVLYMDFFPRESKRGGAWMTTFREMYTAADGTEVRPIVSLCGNFTKPTQTIPSLLTFDEFETLLHEFGHGLHGMLAQGRYSSTTGTNVYRDFVELPSQLMENWATEKEFLDLWAVHYETGEKMPQELIDKIVAAKNYLVTYSNVRQLSFGIGDMAWHSITDSTQVDIAVDKFEKNAVSQAQFFPFVEGTCMAPAFGHIFSGGYAAGYYSYKWAEVLEADAYSLFQEKGILSREAGDAFLNNILSKGGSEHPMELYVRFRGHKPDVNALLKKMGL